MPNGLLLIGSIISKFLTKCESKEYNLPRKTIEATWKKMEGKPNRQDYFGEEFLNFSTPRNTSLPLSEWLECKLS